MFSGFNSWWRNWRFRRTGVTEHTLKGLRKLHQDENEFVRLVAAVSILKLDPSKSVEFMPHIQAARGSENLEVSDLAEEFIAGIKRHTVA